MTEVVISKKRIVVGILIAVLVAAGIWGFSFIRQYLPGQVVAASAPTPGLSSTPGEDQLAQTAAQAGAQAFYTVDYQGGQQAWLDRLCAVSTDIGCTIDQNVLAPALWTQFDQAKTKTTVQVSAQIKTVNGVATTRSNAPFQVWRLNVQLSKSWPMQKPPQTSFQALALVVKDSSAWKFERFLTEEEAKAISQKDLTTMNAIRLFVLLSIIAILAAPFGIAQADGSSPWSEILNPDGSIQWNKLTDLGVTHQAASWMDITLPGGAVITQQATYHRYRTPSGNVLVLPSPGTLFFMALNPKSSGLTGAQSMLGDGASILLMLLGKALTPDQLAQMATKGYTDPKQFFQAVIAGKENIWSIINFTFFSEIIKMSRDSGFLVNALLLYLNGTANCSSIPGGCTGLVAAGCTIAACLPKPSMCPAPTLSQAAATLAIQKIAPGHPLVVGQDPNKRGADIQVSATIPPVIFTWYEQFQDPPNCLFDSSGNGHGCGGPGSKYGSVLDQSGNSISWSSSMENNSSWKIVDGSIRCIRHVEVLSEAITSVQANAQLDAKSQSWILSDLAGKYYEAYIHRASFNLVSGIAQATSGCGSDKTCSAKTLVSGVPFADPGTFNLRMAVSTAGTSFIWKGVTIPITQPRVLITESSMQVYVTLVTLIPAGVP